MRASALTNRCVGRQLGLTRGGEHIADGFFLQTKFTPPTGQVDVDPSLYVYDYRAAPSEQVFQSFKVSQKCANLRAPTSHCACRNLGVKQVDSLVLHIPYKNFNDTMVLVFLPPKFFVRNRRFSGCLALHGDSIRSRPGENSWRFKQ